MELRAMLFGGVLLFAGTASAQGVFSFDDIPIDREPTVEVNMGPEMINLLGGATKQPGQAGPLDGITNVRVLVYEDIEEDMQAVASFVESSGARLERDGWQAVVRVRDGDENVRVYMRPGADGTLAGITVMVMDSGGDAGRGEAVFLNVAGAIQPEQLGHIASTMGMGGMFRGMPNLPGSYVKGEEE